MTLEGLLRSAEGTSSDIAKPGLICSFTSNGTHWNMSVNQGVQTVPVETPVLVDGPQRTSIAEVPKQGAGFLGNFPLVRLMPQGLTTGQPGGGKTLQGNITPDDHVVR